MAVPEHLEFFIDPGRCIGCQACVQACTECDTHKGQSMIQLDYIDRAASTQNVPIVCMHCDSPTCAEVCPADAIKRTADGVVQTARKARCIACNNCVLACPSQALFYGTRDEIERMRPSSRPTNAFQFGAQTITTKVNIMIPVEAPREYVDVTDALADPPIGQSILLEMANLDWDTFIASQEARS